MLRMRVPFAQVVARPAVELPVLARGGLVALSAAVERDPSTHVVMAGRRCMSNLKMWAATKPKEDSSGLWLLLEILFVRMDQPHRIGLKEHMPLAMKDRGRYQCARHAGHPFNGLTS